MKKTRKNTPSFSMHFRTLTTVVETSDQGAKSQASNAMTARISRLKLAAEYIRSGGELKTYEFKRLSLPEQGYLQAVKLGQDPDVQKVVADIGDTVTRGIQAVRTFTRDIFGKR